MIEAEKDRFFDLVQGMAENLRGKDMTINRLERLWDAMKTECTIHEFEAAVSHVIRTEEWQPPAKTLLAIIISRRPVETIKPEKREPMKIPPKAAAMIADILARGNVEVIR